MCRDHCDLAVMAVEDHIAVPEINVPLPILWLHALGQAAETAWFAGTFTLSRVALTGRLAASVFSSSRLFRRHRRV